MKLPSTLSTRRQRSPFVSAIASLVALTAPVWAANIWDGGGIDGKWSTLQNWDDDQLPNFAAGLTFAGATNLIVTNDLIDRTVGGLTFDATAGSFVLDGNLITLNGNITDNSASFQTINQRMALGAATTVNVAFGGSLTVGPGGNGTGVISGGFGLTKAGAGTLTLGAANTYTGPTILDGGTLAYTAGNTAGALQFGAAPTTSTVSISPSALDLNLASLTASSLAVQTNSGSPNTIAIGAGNTLAVGGAVTVGVSNVYTDLFAGVTTNLAITGGGTLAVNSGAGHFAVALQRANAASGTDPNATVDLSGLSHFIFTATSGELRIGAGNATGTLRLANTSNTITTAQLQIGNTGTGGGNNGATGNLFLGSGTNVINTNTINVGMTKGAGNFRFMDAGGSLTLAGQAGGTSTVNITIGDGSNATGSGATSQFLLEGHNVTVQAGTVRVGQTAGSATGNGGFGALTFDTGTFNANALILATNSGSGATGTANAVGTVTIGGPFPNPAATGVLNVRSQFLLANRTVATNPRSVTGTFIMNGGTANIDADIAIVDNSAGAAARVTTLTLAGGTLNMMGHAIGSAALPIDNVNLPGFGQTATLANLGGSGINGAGLNFTQGGTLILAGTNTYAGSTTIGAGSTLQIGTGDDSGTLGSGPVANDGMLIINRLGTLSIAGGISGTGSLEKRGAGSAVVVGGNNYTGATIIQEGALSLTGTVGSLTLAPGTSFRTGYGGVATGLTATSLTVNGGNLLFDFDATGPLITAAGAVTFDGASTLVPNSAVSAGTYTLVSANSLTLTTTPALVAPVGTRKTFTADYGTANTIKLVVAGASKALTWSGNSSGAWDLGPTGTQNWRDGALNETFFQADSVSFLDGPANRAVTINGVTVQPAAILVSNSLGNDYSISGTGAIGGAAALLKNGTGALSIATANTFTGGTTLDAGTLNIHHPSALGTGPIVIAGGSLGNASGAAVALSTNNPQSWSGNFAFAGPNPLDLGTGAVTLGGDVEVTVSASALTVGGLIQGAFGLTKNGPGTLILTGSNGAPTTTVSAGALQVGNGGATGSLSGTSIENNGTLRFNRSADLTVTTAISGAGDLFQAGTNILTLAGANTYTGPTLITSGMLRVTSNTSLGALAGDVIVASGAVLDLSGNLTAQALNFGGKVFRIAGNGPDGNGAITNGGVSQQNALQHVVLTANASVGGSQRFDIRSVPTTTLGATLDLAGHTLTKTGSNEFILVGTDVSDGNIVVNQGTFGMETVSNVPDFGTGTKITMNAGTSLRFFNNIAPVSTVLRPIVFNGAGIRIGNNNNANSIIGSPMTLNGDISVETFNNNAANSLTLTGVIGETGAHSITKNGIGSLFLAGANTYSGGTILNAGTLGLHHPMALGTGPLTVAGGSLTNLSGAAITLTGNNAQTWNADITFTGVSPLDMGTGAVTLTADRNITVNDSELAIGGPISGAFALTKAGPGRLALNGISTNTGGIAVNAGTLLVNGSVTGALVSAGGILGGDGFVGGLALAGGILAPGASPGILNTGGLLLDSGTFAVELDGQTPGKGAGFYDQVNVAGSVAFNNPITLTLDFSFFDPEDGGDVFAILVNDGADPISFANNDARFVYGGLTLNEGDLFTATSGQYTQLFAISYAGGTSNNDVVLHAVPEPGAIAVFLGGLGMLAGIRRRRSTF